LQVGIQNHVNCYWQQFAKRLIDKMSEREGSEGREGKRGKRRKKEREEREKERWRREGREKEGEIITRRTGENF
jgi:hypothetical protein